MIPIEHPFYYNSMLYRYAHDPAAHECLLNNFANQGYMNRIEDEESGTITYTLTDKYYRETNTLKP
jgi:hypothetical protein